MTSDATADAGGQLAKRLREGDPDALRECFNLWARLIHSIANTALDSSADADDVTQQVFIAAWHSRATLRTDTNPLPGWLVGICRHKVVDALRQRSRRQQTLEAAEPVNPAQWVDAIIDRLVLDKALAELGEPRATVIRLVHLTGLPQQAVATQLGLPLGTVKSHVRRGLESLRHTLEEVNPDHGR